MVSPAIVLLPLYIYPKSGAWNFVTAGINANKNLQFHVIINPSSGPGSSQYPDASYIAGISSLNSLPNVKLLGYVHTGYATRPISEVKHNISMYAGWTNYTHSDIHLSGIFFDETSSTPSPTVLNYMQSLANYTNQTMGAGRNFKTYNPGVKVDALFYNTADMVIAMENDYTLTSLNISLNQIPQPLRRKTGIILHNFPNSTLTQVSVLNQMTSLGFGSIFLSTGSNYSVVSQQWPQFCSGMASPVAVNVRSMMTRYVGRSWDLWSPWKTEVL